ncbi:MAG: site-2 protease family protein [Cyanobacteria bacterium P01_D01_bin.105]
MPLIFLALFLGLVTYLVISRSFTNMTTTPVWMLWLVMMTPVLVLTIWMLVNGEEPPPPVLIYGLLILCPLLYAVMILVGAGTSEQGKKAIATAKAAQVNKAKVQKKTKPITRDEETLLQRCFPWSIYYLQDIEYRPQAMICKGKLKASPGEAYQAVQKNVQSSFGDRFLVLFQEGLNGTPFFALVPNPQSKMSAAAGADGGGFGLSPEQKAQADKLRKLNAKTLTRPGLALALAVTTLITTTFAGVSFIGGVEDPQALQSDPTLIRQGLAYGLSLMVILGVHESGHYLATRYHKLKSTLPYFIPVPFFLGTFGAFIQMRSPMPNRRALFDIGIAGPLAGLAVSLPILFWGLLNSSVVPLGESSQLFTFETLDPSRSILLLVISKLALGSSLQADSALQLHPVAISGFLGLIVTALNLMPVGQLDGGHIVHAMYGQRTAAVVSQVARLLMLLMSFVYQEYFLWAILLLFIPSAEPALNDVSELNGRRDFLGLLSLTLLVMIILPAPATLSRILL